MQFNRRGADGATTESSTAPGVLLSAALDSVGGASTPSLSLVDTAPTAESFTDPAAARLESAGEHASGSTAIAGHEPERQPHSAWRPKYRRAAVAIDALAGIVGVLLGLLWHGLLNQFSSAPSVVSTAVLLPVGWVVCIYLSRGYEAQFLGAGTIELERVGRSFLYLVALTTFWAFATQIDLSRGFVLIALPVMLALSLGGRFAVRKTLHRRRKDGRAMASVLAIGGVAEIARFADGLAVASHAGLRVTAACVTRSDESSDLLAARGILRSDSIDEIRAAVAASYADCVAVVSGDVSGEQLRWISWQLEGTETDLVVLPALTEVTGRRINLHAVGEMPLLYVARPEFTGGRRFIKTVFDRSAAAIALLLLAPIMLAIAAAVRITSRGPAFFVQTRVGKDGTAFRMVKFRSMTKDAERVVVDLQASNESEGGVLFKIKNDPRVTRVGKTLRRYSLDELPQLFNVLTGSMSLVGPRPPLPSEVAKYGGDVHRRLLVKPGLTGLWQVSGRSDLSWDESVRLDLRYVENWSLALDMVVLMKTASAVVRSSGAY